MLCRPADGGASAACQAEAVYETLLEALASEGVGPAAVVADTLFLRRVGEDAQSIPDARRRVLERNHKQSYRPVTTLIGQPPLCGNGHLQVAAVAVVPRRPELYSATDVRLGLSCSCDACKPGARAQGIRLEYAYALIVQVDGHPVLALKVDDMGMATRVVRGAKLDLVDQAQLGWEERA